jgi:hypothetical protein
MKRGKEERVKLDPSANSGQALSRAEGRKAKARIFDLPPSSFLLPLFFGGLYA